MQQIGVYQGCWTDEWIREFGTWQRVLPVTFAGSHVRQTCVKAAFAAGYKYAGLQHDASCYAGNYLGMLRVLDSQCNEPCAADPTQTCGGNFLNQIYSTGL